ncbi:MAG: hypothetical protein IJ007_10065 [Oscillospiraceae bacterium]|nr:hypothetical protein [Oscillospiraceae bacterium]
MKIKQFASGIFAAALMAVSVFPVASSADEWKKTDKGYIYEYDDGSTAEKGWLKLDSGYYYIQKDGTRKTGWLKTSGGKYYFDKNGVMYRSKWLKMKSGTKYYMKSDGKTATGLVKLNGVTYKFDDDGVCLGENYKFILNRKTMCLHSDSDCMAAKKIKKANRGTVNIGADELDDMHDAGYWACGMDGCNPAHILAEMPKHE